MEVLEYLRQNPDKLKNLAPAQAQQLAALVEQLKEQVRFNKIDRFYPDTGELRRELYPKHQAFLRAGAGYRERAAIAANQVGKSEGLGAYEMALHLTGIYPDWWEGVRFDKPIKAWAGGDTNFSVRDNCQVKLLGEFDAPGTGMLRKECVLKTTKKPGVPDAIETAHVKHVSGGTSIIVFKSYESGRKGWQGPVIDYVWMDEEPPVEIYSEALMRTINAPCGRIVLTFTPLNGWTDVVSSFLNDADRPEGGRLDEPTSKFLVSIGWDDVPHLSPKAKAEILESTPAHLREARSKGLPTVGEGLVFRIPDEAIIVQPFQLPAYWPRIIGLDFGIDHPTAAAWVAWDRDMDIMYLFRTYAKKGGTPAIHAPAIKAAGAWIPVVWPHDGLVRDKGSGVQLKALYEQHGINMLYDKFTNPEGGMGREAGIMEMEERMETGRLKVFSTCSEFLDEKKLYHRKDGKLIDRNDDVISAARYAIMSIDRFGETEPVKRNAGRRKTWRPADKIGGY